jgi:hypothetical protein
MAWWFEFINLSQDAQGLLPLHRPILMIKKARLTRALPSQLQLIIATNRIQAASVLNTSVEKSVDKASMENLSNPARSIWIPGLKGAFGYLSGPRHQQPHHRSMRHSVRDRLEDRVAPAPPSLAGFVHTAHEHSMHSCDGSCTHSASHPEPTAQP